LKQAILPEHLTAYKLHPEYQVPKLSAAQTEVVNEFLVSKNPTFIAELITFQAKSSPYPKAFFTEAALSIDPITWWNTMKPSGVNSDFVDFVVHLQQSPASIEQIFSNFGLIHNKVRNKLRGDVEIDY